MTVDFGPWDRKLSAWPAVSAGVDMISVRGLKVTGVAADLRNFSLVTQYDTGADYDFNEVRLMRLDRVAVRGLTIEAGDLKAFLEKRVPGLKVDAVTLEGTGKGSGSYRGKPVSAEAALELDKAGHRLKVAVISASYIGLPLPAALVRPIKELNLSLGPNPEPPFYNDL